MMRSIGRSLGVFALLVLPLVGCGGSSDEGMGGTAGTAGTGGAAGAGGMGGAGGAEPITSGPWTGSSDQGPDETFTICFNVSEDGTALLAEGLSCMGHSLVFDFNPSCSASFISNEQIPIVDGAFNYEAAGGGATASGIIDGEAASGEAMSGDCSTTWEATPSP